MGMSLWHDSRSVFIAKESTCEEHLLVSKALPICLAPHYFSACSDESLLCEADDLSTHSEV
jgi:hypothetical protein